MQQRPNSVLGLTRHLVRTRWQSLSPRGKTLSVVAAVLFGAAAFVGARSLACCAGGCPYQEAMEAAPAMDAHVDSTVHESSDESSDTGGCPHSRRR